MSVELAELGIHSIHGQGSGGGGGSGEKNIHRLLRWYTTASEADERHPAGDWLHDLDATDPSDPSGHPMVTADQLFEWYEDGQIFELYEVDVEDGQLGWSAVYRMVTWQDQSEWWSQSAEVPGKAVRIEFFRMGMYSTPYRGGLVAYIRYQDEQYMRLYEILPGESIWIAEYQEKLPYYDRSWHAGDFLRVKQDGSDLEWAPLSEVASSGSYDDLIDKPDLSGYATDAELSDGLATKQDTLTAGSNITIQNNVISANAESQVNADWNATSGVAEILNKPTIPVVPAMKDLVAGANVTITESSSSVTISAAGSAQVNADWNATSGVAEILNKPTIPVVPAMKDLVAGSGIEITEGSSSVTISATGTSYTAGTGINIQSGVISADTTVLALKSELHTIGTVTL
jgi:hypothetical protein